MTKKKIRQQLQRQQADPDASRRLVERLVKLPVFQEAETIGAFMPLPDEPDIRPLFDLPDKRFFIPSFDEKTGAYCMAALDKNLKRGKFGIPEPAQPVKAEMLDLILAPGAAFDRTGNRLGRGGGFYDRLLANCPGTVPIGLCFDSRIAGRLPVEPHDRPMRWIVTESQVLGPF